MPPSPGYIETPTRMVMPLYGPVATPLLSQSEFIDSFGPPPASVNFAADDPRWVSFRDVCFPLMSGHPPQHLEIAEDLEMSLTVQLSLDVKETSPGVWDDAALGYWATVMADHAAEVEKTRPLYHDHEVPARDGVGPEQTAQQRAAALALWDKRIAAVRDRLPNMPQSAYMQFDAFLPFQNSALYLGSPLYRQWEDHINNVLGPWSENRWDFIAPGMYWYSGRFSDYIEQFKTKISLANLYGKPVRPFLSGWQEGLNDEPHLTRWQLNEILAMADDLCGGYILWGGGYDNTSSNNFPYDGLNRSHNVSHQRHFHPATTQYLRYQDK